MIMKKVFLFISTFPISLPAELKTNFNGENTSIVGKFMFLMMMVVHCTYHIRDGDIYGKCMYPCTYRNIIICTYAAQQSPNT